MKRLVRSAIMKISPSTFALLRGLKLLYSKNSYLVTTGFMHSLKVGRPCRQDGSPLPWMNYNVISFLEARLHKDLTVFEYGSGYSTLFFSARVSKVVSVEYDREWYEKIQKKLPGNVQLILKDTDHGEEYCQAINRTDDSYDLVIIDGRDRVRCAMNASHALSDKGVIIFDDSHRAKYKEGIDFLLAKGFRTIDLEGLQPAGFTAHKTSVFYKSNNCLGI